MKVSAVFDFAGEGPRIAGFHNPAIRWNGWACPSFTLDAVRTLAEWLAGQDPYDGYDTVTVRDGGSVAVTTFDGEVYDVTPDDDGLYGVGAYAWVWSEVE
jgi:hypothetical protein